MNPETVEVLRRLDASTVYEANGKQGDLPAGLVAIAGARFAGPAYTVKCWPGDLGAVRRAVDAAPPGSVLVIDSGCGAEGTTWGGGATIAALRRGLAGVVTNGRTRDVAQIRALAFPVICAGPTVRGGTRHEPGWVQVAIALGGTVVHPGDLVLSDEDGAVVVRAAEAQRVAARAQEKAAKDEAREQRLREGEPYDA